MASSQRLFVALVLACAMASGVASGRVLRGEQAHRPGRQLRAAWWGTQATDECTPFNPQPYGDTLDGFCARLASLSDDSLEELWRRAPVPTAEQGFPLRGCTYGCIASNSGWLSQVARNVNGEHNNGLGWLGKCHSFDLDPATGVPQSLVNAFDPAISEAGMSQAERLGHDAYTAAWATVGWQSGSYSDGKPVWAYNYTHADLLPFPAMGTNMDVSGVRDEVRLVSPGFLLGKMFIQSPDWANGKGVGPNRDGFRLPIFFAQFQACTSGGHFATSPADRAVPGLGDHTRLANGGLIF